MKIIWEGTIDGSSTAAVYRVLIDDQPSKEKSHRGSALSLLPFVVERRGFDSLGAVRWDLESLDNTGYKQAIARAFEYLTRMPDADIYEKCGFCEGVGYVTKEDGSNWSGLNSEEVA